MSGDVQPRKRKDKKKKKDDLGIEEPRGTAAALGEGDVFMHYHHDHGTGGHWCAKVIFFSLLAVLITLIGLIILENRGLSDLEANSVESRYSGVLDGWLEEGHDDDHHDEHTLELNHHDDEDDDDDDVSGGVDHGDHDDEGEEELSHEVDEGEDDDQNQDDDDESNQNNDDDDDDDENQDDDDESNQDEDDDDEKNLDEDNDAESSENKEEQNDADEDDADSQQDDDDRNSDEQNLDTAEDEDEVEEPSYRRYYRSVENRANDDDDDDQKVDELDDDDDQSVEMNNDDVDKPNEDDDSQENDDDEAANNDSNENDDDDNDENNEINENSDENKLNEDDEDNADHNDHSEDEEVELEHIEEEIFDDGVSNEAPARKDRDSGEASKETSPFTDADDDEVELLEPDELDELPEELPIPVPKGRPLVEVEDAPSTEKPQDTLADEEEYERQQEALRKEKEQASQGMWLKIVVGGALLVATQAVLRRATVPPRESDDEVSPTREETPLSDRRMTLIAEPVPPPVSSKPQEVSRPVVEKEVVRQAPIVKSAPPPEDDEDEEIIVTKDTKQEDEDDVDRELYSDEEEEVEEEEEEPEEPPKPLPKLISLPKEPPTSSKPISLPNEPPKPVVKETPKVTTPPKVVEKEPTPEDDEDDVEIIEEEDIGEDLEEEEEEISDVDDVELLNRLEAKYGRLPDTDASRKKEGGNSIEDEWPGEPSDAYWRDELDGADRDLRQGEWSAAAERAGAPELRQSARARYIVARARDAAAEAKRDNNLLSKAIAAYLDLLKMNEKLSDKKLVEVTDRTLDRMKFRGNYMGTEPIYRLLIRRFPDNPMYQNNLTVAFLMANRIDLAEEVIKEILKRWPDDRMALAHHGFILKTLHNKLDEAVDAFTKALEGDTGPANEPRFYYHFGDSLLLLGRFKEAHEVHKRGAKLGHFLSPAQRSLYNVDRLKSQPWWDVQKTPYARLAKALEKSWKEILKEGRAAQALYEKEKEGLKERGEWSQLDLFVRGREVPNRCARAPVTCGVVRSEAAASGCRRGQVKFSAMEAGTHVRPHVGPTNCRLRMHLGLSNTKDTFIRVDQETRQWQTGKVLMFDDSFEHEVWHNGTGTRLVLIVDVWHPDLTRTERAQLPAI